MKAATPFVLAIALLISADNLPAPITEAPATPTPAPPVMHPGGKRPLQNATPSIKHPGLPPHPHGKTLDGANRPSAPPAKPKATELESNPTSARAQRFDGTWFGTSASTTADGKVTNANAILVIKDGKTASWTGELTETLASGAVWNKLPEQYNRTSPVYRKFTNDSANLTVEGSNLTIRWSGPNRLSDWSTTIPYGVIQKLFGDTPKTSSYTLSGDLSGDHLTTTDFTFNRVK